MIESKKRNQDPFFLIETLFGCMSLIYKTKAYLN